MRRVRIVANGSKVGAEPYLATLVDRLRSYEHVHVDVRETWEAGDALAIAAEASALGVDVIAAAGGDGTLHEVINGVARQENRPAVGVIPLGTANDFAVSAGIDPTTPLATAELIAHAEPHACDVVKVGDKFMLNVAAGGFPADAAGNAGESMKRAFGGLAYLLSGVAHLGSYDAQYIEVEGPDFQWSGSFLGFAVANARCAGGGHRVAPEALIDDGQLDVVVVPGNLRLFEAARLGSDFKIEAVEEHVCRWRAPWVKLSRESQLRMNIDGEPYRVKSAKFECLPQHQPLLLPPHCRLIASSEESPREERPDTHVGE